MNASVHKKQELLNSTTIVRKDKQNLAENVLVCFFSKQCQIQNNNNNDTRRKHVL